MFLVRLLDYLVRSALKLLFYWTGRSIGPAEGGPSQFGSSAYTQFYNLLLDFLIPQGISNRELSTSHIVLATWFGLRRRLRPGYLALLRISTFYLIIFLRILPITARVAFVLAICVAAAAYVHLALHTVPFAKVLFGWLSLGAFFYLLFSGFVYFTNKLSYSSNVDVMQRFWKKTFSVFWLIEAGLFAFFVYMTMNASSEVWASYDTPSLFKTQFFSLKMLFVRLWLISVAILLTSALVSTVHRQNSYSDPLLQFLITTLIVMSLWIESYQFYLFVLCAPSYGWAFNADIHESSIDADTRRNRLLRNFVFICAMAKFWHFIFIATNWLFYLNRQLEHYEARAGLLNSNIQNLLILYVLNLITMFPYVKHLIHRGLAKPYFWFLIEEGNLFVPVFKEFCYNFYVGLIF